MTPGFDLAGALADAEVALCVARVARTASAEDAGRPAGAAGFVVHAVVERSLAASSLAALPDTLALAGERYEDPEVRARDGSNPWHRLGLVPGERLLLAVRPRDGGWAVSCVEAGASERTAEAARACEVARGPVDLDARAAVVAGLRDRAGLVRAALLRRLARDVPRDVAVDHLVAALEALEDCPVRERLGDALETWFEPERWADRMNAAVVTALARGVFVGPRAVRLAWAGRLARCLRWPFDPAPERQERVARALVLLVDASPVEVVAALEGLAGAGAPDEQAAVRDVLALWLQL